MFFTEKMKFFLRPISILLLALSLCFSCSQKPAQVVNRSKNVYNKKVESNKTKPTSEKVVKKPKSSLIEVGAGDTLYSISKKYQVSLHDLIKQNNLTPPYNLKNGTVIDIPAQTYHEVKAGDTIYGISRSYNMKINNLIEINELKEPYILKAGTRIKVTKASDSNIVTNATPAPETKIVEKAPPPKNIPEPEVEEKEEKSDAGFVEKILDKLNHFSWPIRGQIISKFGPKSGGLYNDGINIKAAEGSAVKSAEDGVVAYVGNELKGYGNLVIIKHSGGWITAYAHLANSSVKRGQTVKKGTKIGTVGATGNVTSPQLYFGLRKGRDAVNPENYLK